MSLEQALLINNSVEATYLFGRVSTKPSSSITAYTIDTNKMTAQDSKSRDCVVLRETAGLNFSAACQTVGMKEYFV